MIVRVVTNWLVIGWIVSLVWGVPRSYPLSTAIVAPFNNHVRSYPWVDSYCCGALQQPWKPIAIWSPKAMSYSSEVCDYIERSLPFLAWSGKSVQDLKQVVDISSYRETRAIMSRWSCSFERWDETWWDGNSLFSISSTDEFCIHHGWMIATLYCARLWISQTCKDSEAGVHNPPTLALLSKGYFFFVCCFIL